MIKTKPLQGIIVLNTRPKEQAKALTKAVLNAGGLSIECSTIEITPRHPQQLSHTTFDIVIFTSRYAIMHMQASIKEPLKKSGTFYAIGDKTAEAALMQGFNVDCHPFETNSEGLLNVPELNDVVGKKIAIIKGCGGRTLLASSLEKRGAQITLIDTYERHCPTSLPLTLQKLWKKDTKFLILGTSVESIDNLFVLLECSVHDKLRTMPWLVMSERIQKAALKHGIKHTILSSPQSFLDDLLQIKSRIHL